MEAGLLSIIMYLVYDNLSRVLGSDLFKFDTKGVRICFYQEKE